MKSFHNISELEAKIAELKKLSNLQEALIFSKFKEIKEDVSPVNLMKKSLHSLMEDSEVRKNIMERALELTLVWMGKKWIGKKGGDTALTLAESGLFSDIIHAAFENKEYLKAYGKKLLNKILGRGSTDQPEMENQEK